MIETTTTSTTVKKNLSTVSTADNDCLMYRPFQSPVGENTNLNIKRDHYSTSLDSRGYIPVYEYIINNTPIMWDRETGYVHFTGIWKALGNSKSDIVKMVDSNPELGTKKIRGGFLRIQGTWIPYEYAHLLCKRTAWHIRKDLIPIFGQRFPLEALHPDHPDYGCLLLDPKNMSVNGKNSVSQNKRNTMRQNNNKPYSKQQQRSTTTTNIKKPRLPKPMKSITSTYMKKKLLLQKQQQQGQNKIASSMSVTRLLNQVEVGTIVNDYDDDYDDVLSSEEELTDDGMMTDDNGTSSCSSVSSINSPTSASLSPSFRVIQTYPPNEDWLNQVPLLPPIYNNSGCASHTTLPPTACWPSETPATTTALLPSLVTSTHIAQDIIDTISATILLQRLSQDDGARPFKPLGSSSVIPNKVIVGHQEFTICWD